MNGGWLWGRNLSSLFCEFESSLVQELELFQEYGLFGDFHKTHEICEFWVPQSLLGD